MDFDEIESKCGSNQYRIVDEFRADCQLIVHNVVIFHGGKCCEKCLLYVYQ